MSATSVRLLTHHKCLFTFTESKRLLEGILSSPPDVPRLHPWITIILCHLMLVGVAGSSHGRQPKEFAWRVDFGKEFWDLFLMLSHIHSGPCGRLIISLCLILPNINNSLVCKLLRVQNTLLGNQICLWILFIRDLLWWSQLQFLGLRNWISLLPSLILLMSQLVCLHESELVIT